MTEKLKLAIFGHRSYLGQRLMGTLDSATYEILLPFESSKSPSIAKYDINHADYSRNIEQILKFNPDVVLNLAWISNSYDYHNSQLNELFSLFCIRLYTDLSVLTNVRFIGLGSCAEYGTNPGICHEKKTKLQATNEYSRCKIETYFQLLHHQKTNKIPFVWLRPFQVYGPSQGDHRLLDKLLKSTRLNHKIIIKNPEAKLDWIHVDDVVAALQIILENDISGPINVGTTQETSIREIVSYFRRLAGTEFNISLSAESSISSICVASKDSEIYKHGWKPRNSLWDFIREEISIL